MKFSTSPDFSHPFPVLGLSGGIAAGTSFVAKCLAERGWVVIDADALAREAVAPGSEEAADAVSGGG